MRRGRDALGRAGRQAAWLRVTAAASSATLLGTLGLAGTSMAATSAAANAAKPAAATADTSCHLGNGVKHVVTLVFDNVHYFRDNPNVPSDLEQIPNLLNFFTSHGTFLSNNHTPLIAHTGDNILTTLTGLYGDRHGMPISNSYQAYNADGTTDPAGSFAYWTDPVFDTAKTPNPGHDTNPSMVYSPVPPATAAHPAAPDTVTPAPWVPYTRAGCDVGEVATANQELENTAVDIPKVFGAGSPEDQQLSADPDSFKDAEVADYVGVGVHCAQGNAFCATAKGVKFGQTDASPTAVSDLLPDEPGGYNGFQALFGHRYVAPQLGAGTPNLSSHGVPVTNAAGNLTDENGNQINGAFLTNHPGFPGFGPINASQSLAYMADMLESGVPVVNGYIADIHGNEGIPALAAACAGVKSNAPLGPGTPCYIAQAKYYNDAFGAFFKRLAADGITPANTLTFDKKNRVWFTGQSGFYGRLDPATGDVNVWKAPRGRGPYGITTTPSGDVYYASLAGSHIARIDVTTGEATVIEPPTRNQGARRVWSDSKGRIWVSYWNSGHVGMYDPGPKSWKEWKLPGNAHAYSVWVDPADKVWLTDWSVNALVRFDPLTEKFETFPSSKPQANVRQMLGRSGEAWGAESGTDRLVMVPAQ